MRDRSPSPAITDIAAIALLAYLFVLLALTLQPTTADVDSALRMNFRPFASIGPALRLGPESFAFRQVLGNVAAFVPLGVLLPMLWPRLSLASVLLIGLGLSLAIEASQLGISLALDYGYRRADIDDVILNTTGAMIGYTAFMASRTLLRLAKVRG